MAEKQISGVLAKEDGINLMMISIIILWYFINDSNPYHAEETVGKKYAALLIQHIWRSRAARTRKVMEMFQGSQGTIRLRVSDEYREQRNV